MNEDIENDLLLLFEQSIGLPFRIKATPLTDVVDGVDKEMKMVKGRKYGSFAVSLCELIGGEQQLKES